LTELRRIAFLVVIFQVEVLVANFSGYSTSEALLNSFSREGKIFVAASICPFVHQGPQHLRDNLAVFAVAGS
jgi:membrane associated rhomboid family serine protease